MGAVAGPSASCCGELYFSNNNQGRAVPVMQSNYENYPFWMMAVSNAVSISIYAIGLFIMYQSGTVFALIYLCYCILVEINLYRKSCVNCYYYGRLCGFGKGKVCSFIFPKGDPEKFIERKLTWKDLIPDMLVLIIPLVGGIISLFLHFNWIIIVALIFILFLSFMGNAFVRRTFSCKYCKQKELGCPAAQFFNQINK
jgi:hypothetical protein